MDTLQLARAWAGLPAGKVLGTEQAEGVQAVVDAARLDALRRSGYDAAIEAAIEDPAPAPRKRKGARRV